MVGNEFLTRTVDPTSDFRKSKLIDSSAVQLLREQKITPKSKNKVTKRQEVQTLVVSGVETSAHKRTDTITSLQETERGQMSFK